MAIAMDPGVEEVEEGTTGPEVVVAAVDTPVQEETKMEGPSLMAVVAMVMVVAVVVVVVAVTTQTDMVVTGRITPGSTHRARGGGTITIESSCHRSHKWKRINVGMFKLVLLFICYFPPPPPPPRVPA